MCVIGFLMYAVGWVLTGLAGLFVLGLVSSFCPDTFAGELSQCDDDDYCFEIACSCFLPFIPWIVVVISLFQKVCESSGKLGRKLFGTASLMDLGKKCGDKMKMSKKERLQRKLAAMEDQ